MADAVNPFRAGEEPSHRSTFENILKGIMKNSDSPFGPVLRSILSRNERYSGIVENLSGLYEFRCLSSCSDLHYLFPLQALAAVIPRNERLYFLSKFDRILRILDSRV